MKSINISVMKNTVKLIGVFIIAYISYPRKLKNTVKIGQFTIFDNMLYDV